MLSSGRRAGSGRGADRLDFQPDGSRRTPAQVRVIRLFGRSKVCRSVRSLVGRCSIRPLSSPRRTVCRLPFPRRSTTSENVSGSSDGHWSTIQVAVAGTDEALIGPTITPDGAFVEFVRYSSSAQRVALWRVALLGGQETKVVTTSSPLPDAPPATNHVLAPVNGGQEGRCWSSRTRLGGRETILRTRTGAEAFTVCCDHFLSHIVPAWSPDGGRSLCWLTPREAMSSTSSTRARVQLGPSQPT